MTDFENHNLFLVLGKYVQRQDENLLTQSLVLLFNRSGAFREQFWTRIRAASAVPFAAPDGLLAFSQVRRNAHGKQIQVDMEIRRQADDVPLCLVECKLDSGLGVGQISKYKSALKKLKGKAKLVIITRYGVDEELSAYVPKGTGWLSWPVIAELALRATRQAPKLDNLLLRDFLDMLKFNGIEMLPPVAGRNWGRLKRISRFALLENSHRLGYLSLAATELAFRRLITFRDAAWGGIFSEKGVWRPHQAVYKLEASVVLHASFYRLRPRKHVAETSLGFELECGEKPRMYIVRGELLASTHPRYKRGDSFSERELGWYTSKDTRKFFAQPVSDAVEAMGKDMRSIARQYLKSLSN
jgi:hypothetical protein